MSALLAALKSTRAAGGTGFDLATAFTAIFRPADIGGWLVLVGFLPILDDVWILSRV